MVVILCLNHGNRDVRFVVEDVVGPLPLAACVKPSPDIDPTIRKIDLTADLKILIPASGNDVRSDKLRTDVAFGKVLFVHAENGETVSDR